MNVVAISCALLASIFLILSVIFALLKEKGAILISGFNTLSKEERLKYNRLKMSKDMRNSFFLWFILFAAGGVLSYVVSTNFAVIAFILWLILFFKEVHFDTEKAFEEYKL